jgi:MinD superfamily P-loop ATPase
VFPPSNVIIPALDYARCQACQPCRAAAHCRFKAFVRIDRDEPPYIDVARCGGCGDCVAHCPFEALTDPRVGKE